MKGALILLGALLMPASAAVSQPPRPAEHVIVLQGMRFGTLPANLKAGDTILWVNRDVVPHTATARDRSFDVTLQPRQSARVTVRRAGNIAFYCRFHPAMQGILRVAAR
jgi:plastocyanin